MIIGIFLLQKLVSMEFKIKAKMELIAEDLVGVLVVSIFYIWIGILR